MNLWGLQNTTQAEKLWLHVQLSIYMSVVAVWATETAVFSIFSAAVNSLYVSLYESVWGGVGYLRCCLGHFLPLCSEIKNTENIKSFHNGYFFSLPHTLR